MTINIDTSKAITFTGKDGPIYNSKKREGTADPSSLPLASLTDFTSKLEGFFRVNVQYGSGIIAVKSNGEGVKPSLFISGPDGIDGDVDSGYNVSEVSPPDVLQATNDEISTVPFATTLQGFTGSLRNRAPTSDWPNNPIELRIMSMHYRAGKLLVNGAIYYDGSGQNTTTSLIVDDASNLAGSNITGQFGIVGAQHVTSWVVPSFDWSSSIGYDYIMGSGQGLAIVSRLSAGPSLFGVDQESVFSASAGSSIPSQSFMDFTLTNPLSDDLLNYGGTKKGRDEGLVNNDLMTSKSGHSCGFLMPGTRTYVVIGRGSGLLPLSDAEDLYWHGSITDFADQNGTIFYKGNVNAEGVAWTGSGAAPPEYTRIANKAGSTGAAGYETYDGADTGTQYLLFDMNEILAASEVYTPRPYAKGYMQDLWPRTHNHTLHVNQGGGTVTLNQTGIPGGGQNQPVSPSWDEDNKKLYLSLPYVEYHSGASGQNYSNKPVIAVYDFS